MSSDATSAYDCCPAAGISGVSLSIEGGEEKTEAEGMSIQESGRAEAAEEDEDEGSLVLRSLGNRVRFTGMVSWLKRRETEKERVSDPVFSLMAERGKQRRGGRDERATAQLVTSFSVPPSAPDDDVNKLGDHVRTAFAPSTSHLVNFAVLNIPISALNSVGNAFALDLFFFPLLGHLPFLLACPSSQGHQRRRKRCFQVPQRYHRSQIPRNLLWKAILRLVLARSGKRSSSSLLPSSSFDRLPSFGSFLNDILISPLPSLQGRILFDVFIYPHPPSSTFLIDYDSRASPGLIETVKKFVLRSKVSLKDVSEQWDVWAAWGHEKVNQEDGVRQWKWGTGESAGLVGWEKEQTPLPGTSGEIGEVGEGEVGGWDLRAPGMGWRGLVKKGQTREFAPFISRLLGSERQLLGLLARHLIFLCLWLLLRSSFAPC